MAFRPALLYSRYYNEARSIPRNEFYVLGLLLMALFVRLYWSRKKYNDAKKLFKKN